jgi:hypothetical protein
MTEGSNKFSFIREIVERGVEQNNLLFQKLESLIGEGMAFWLSLLLACSILNRKSLVLNSIEGRLLAMSRFSVFCTAGYSLTNFTNKFWTLVNLVHIFT